MNEQTNPEPNSFQQDQDYDLIDVWNRVKNLIKAPVFAEDLEKTRIAAILNAILLGIFLIFLVYLGSILITNDTPVVSAIIVLLLEGLIFGSLVAVRRGVVRRTALIFIIVMWLAILVGSALFGQAVNNPIIASMMLVTFAAGYLISNRAAIVVGILSILSLFALHFIGQAIELPAVLESSDSVYLSRLVIMYILAVFFVVVANGATLRILRQIQESDEELRKANEELQEVRSYLEQEVEVNTRALERRSRYLEAAAHVANVSISLLNQQEMIQTVANEITRQFGFYHVGVFLLDERKEWAALRAASSEGGQQMIARNHRLAVGRQGIVGFVTSMGQARISQDTGVDRVHTPAEELPDTRSEMALPLIARGEIIGAIDIQDTKPEAFTQDDITVLQTMADQIALALENIRLYEQTQETLEEVQRVYGEYSERAWRETQQKNLLSSYRYFGGAVTRLNEVDQLEVTENKVSIPVEIRGITLGAIEISKGEEGTGWSDDELHLLHSLADQIGVALDSARLFNESQLRATTEHTISQINSQLWETMDINTILKTTAQNLRQTLALPELTIRMTAPEAEIEPSTNGKLDADESEAAEATD